MGALGRRIVTRALLAACGALLIAAPLAAAAPPGSELFPIKGVAYQPAPSDYGPCGPPCAYFDTDFANADFTELWSSSGSGRGDLAAIQSLGANLIRLYNWNPQRNHLPFLNEAHQRGLRIVVPISNYFVLTDGRALPDIVRQVYVDTGGRPSKTPHPAVVAWSVGNEVDLEGDNRDPNVRRANLGRVADAIAALVKAEDDLGATRRLPVSAPVSFATFDDPQPAFSATRTTLEAIRAKPQLGEAFIGSRFFAAVQTFNPGTYLRDWLARFNREFPNLAVWFSELGVPVNGSCGGFVKPPCQESEQQQAAYIAAQWREAPPGSAGGAYLGGTAFEFVDEPWKGGSEGTFGLAKYASPASWRQVGGYRVDALVHKPAWDAFRDPVNGVRLVTAENAARIAGVDADARDVVALDEETGEAELRFDGSEAGVRPGTHIDAATVDPRDGSLLLTFSRAQRLTGVGRVGPSDVVRASGSRLSVVLRAARAGLRGRGADIDALAVDRRGRLVVSTAGGFRAGSHRFAPQDLAVLRRDPRGTFRWRPFLRGADIGLTRPSENVDGAWIDPRTGAVHLTTTGAFDAHGVRGSGADVLVRTRGGGVHLGWRAHAAGVTARGAEGVARDVR
ncbi:MAG TPA: hypothetical protein VNZ62_20005 [Capillimicrobium sp.]|nr:hypothetical protein [Capillimicrobium sp.]